MNGPVVVRDNNAHERMLREESLLDEYVFDELKKSCAQARQVGSALEHYEKKRAPVHTHQTCANTGAVLMD